MHLSVSEYIDPDDSCYEEINKLFPIIECTENAFQRFDIKVWQNRTNTLVESAQRIGEENKELHATYLQEIELVSGKIKKSIEDIGEKIENVEDCKKDLQDLKNKEIKLNAEIERLKNEDVLAVIDGGEEYKRKLELNRDQIRAYKILTGTRFSYKSDLKVFGVITNKNLKSHACLFNKNDMSQDEVANKVWDHLNKASGESWSDIVDLE